MLVVVLHFIFISFLYPHFIFDLHLSMFFICWCSSFTFHLLFDIIPSSPFRGLSPGFYTHFILSALLIAEWFVTLSFSTILFSSYRERYGFEWAFFIHRRCFTLRSFTDILTCVYQGFPRSRQFFLKFAELHTDHWNTDPAHLFVWFTVFHKLHIQNNLALNSTIC